MGRVFATVDARWEPTVSWRGGSLDRLLDEAHARLVAAAVETLRAAGWEVTVEATYSEYGERGSIDILGARRESRAALLVEVKSDLTVIEATLRKADEKERIVRGSLCRDRFGFRPAIVGRLLVLPATDSARRRVRGADVRRWLGRPRGDLSGVLFVADNNRGSGTRGRGGSQRVRCARPRSG
ncbi:MAG: hypothetical protein NVS9B8_06490 [Candidatus Limnocylindrales bacterium]